jgi:hypothetical protein
MDNGCNWNEKVYTTCLSHCYDNGLHQDNYRLDGGCHLDIACNFEWCCFWKVWWCIEVINYGASRFAMLL